MMDIVNHSEFWTYVGIGFLAQIVDGALGMAYGTLCTSVLLASGLPPVTVSASVHTAQFFTTGLSALSHSYFKNVHKKLLLVIAVSGALGGLIGAMLLTQIDGKLIKPWIAAYLLYLGFFILWRRYRGKKFMTGVSAWNRNLFRAVLGLLGGFLDALGGGGWGPIVTSNLIARNEDPRLVIGTVNVAEFFVKTLIAVTFIVTLSANNFTTVVLGLLVGGVVAAPLGAFVLRFIKPETLMGFVGFLIIGLSGFILYSTFF